MHAVLVAAVLAIAMSASMAGCFTCDDHLDVHRCREETGRCDPADEVVIEWTPERQALFPDVGRLMEMGIEDGGHAHATWGAQQTRAFWQFHHVPLDRPDKQLFVRDQGDLYHVRVLAC